MLTTTQPLGGAVSNDQWISTDDVADPTPLPRVPGVGILVRPVPIRKKSAGGILIPETFREDMEYLNTVGRVLALGELSFKDETVYINGPWVKPGDFIVYAKYTGTKFFWRGVKLLIVKPSQIEMVVEAPELLDSNFRSQ